MKQDSIAELFKYIESKRDVPFQYGTNDCFLFVCGALVALGFKNHAKGFSYKKLVTGLRQMKRLHGYDDHIQYFESIFEEIPKAFAQLGDIAVIKTGDEIAIGIVTGPEVTAVSQNGLVHINILDENIIRVLRTE